MLRRLKRNSVALAGGHAEEDSEDETEGRPPVPPLAISQLDTTHKRGVADLAWLPLDCQVNYKGQLLDKDNQGETSNQFITVSGDGRRSRAEILSWAPISLKIARDESSPRRAPRRDWQNVPV